MITVFVNGETRMIATKSTLAELMHELALTGKRIAIEVNQEIVPRNLYDKTTLCAGDRVEIVQAIGGG